MTARLPDAPLATNVRLFLLLLALGCPVARGGDGGPSRLRPPPNLTCPTDHLTSYTGRVVSYRRRPGEVSLRIHTDWDTTESVRLSPPVDVGPAGYFLLNGEPFRESDWKVIESSEGRLRPNVRVTAWVCDDGRPPIIDWRPSGTAGADQAP